MRRLLVGLTGQTGAGKTGVARLLHKRGCGVIDADFVARQVTEPGGGCLGEIAAAFGEGVLLPDGSLNRRGLGDIVFSDAQRRKTLEAIIFPYIMDEIDRQAEELFHAGKEIVFLDAPTLFESGADQKCGAVVSVTAPEEMRLARIIARDGLGPERARRRMSSQQGDDYYTSRSDYVIRNDGPAEELPEKVDDLLRFLYEKFMTDQEDS